MALPKLLQKLFTNGGAGDKLNKSIVPDLDYLPTSGGTMTGDIIFSSSRAKVASDKNTGGRVEVGQTGAALLSNQGDYEGGATLLLRSSAYPNDQRGHFFLLAGLSSSQNYRLVGSPDGSLTWGGKPVLCGESGGFPVGFLALYAGSNVPDGWFRCDGSTIANMATNYPKLYAVLGTNVLPNSSDRCLQGTTLANSIGKTVSAGLPRISGWTRLRGGTANSLITDGISSGAVSQKDYKWNGLHNVWSHVRYTDPLVTELSVDASKSSQIYGASTTVQPPALKVAVLIKHD